jgi:hypothetical protein
MTPALSSDIATYDAFVTAQADEIADLVNLETAWRVIGSTPTISAKFHTGTDNTPPGINGVPIYRLDGALIATDYDDLWDGSLQNPLQIAQDGSLVVSWGSWTGTRTFGRAIPGDELGAADLTVVDGAPFGTGPNWIETGAFGAINPQHLYAISDVLTVPDPTIDVAIDIRPGSDSVCNSTVPVAILGSESFDITQINATTLIFEGAGARERGNGVLSCEIEDVNLDGYADFVCQYQGTRSEGSLAGQLFDGTNIRGVDVFCVSR